MKDVKVDKTELLTTLKNNREKHRAIFLEAQEGYRAAAIAEMDSMMADARDGKKIRRSLTLIEPVDQTDDYDRAIRMLEMSVDTEITLSEYDFASYVLDQWTWKHQFNSSNVRYSKILMDAGGE